jgi:DNA topoisomerase II
MPPKKSIEEKFKKLGDIEHVLKNPGMYIGQITKQKTIHWVLNEQKNSIERKEVNYSPGLYKIFDEILVNAIDHKVRDNSLNQIKIDINKEDNIISIYNNGEGIPVVIHKEEKIYVPELIFGVLKTGTSYDDDEKKTIGGKHGLGAKLTAIFSEEFIIETVDSENSLKYIQKFEKNLSKKNKPKITKFKGKPYTKITFKPDLEKFQTKSLKEDIYKLMKRRAYDIAACSSKDVNVFFNDSKIEIKTFDKYADLFLGSKEENPRVYEHCNDRWEIMASPSKNDQFEQISFVNNIYTSNGGKHVDYILDQITKGLIELIQRKRKNITIKASYVKENIWLFVKSTIENPDFNSQTKETLTSPVKDFGSVCEISKNFIKKLAETEIIDDILAIVESKANKELKKTEGKKKGILKGIPKLDDANKAGKKESAKCKLLLTEGDSAKTFAVSGLSVIGRDYYGVFPLKGKPLNVRDADKKQISNNTEINFIKQIMGLQHDKEYTKENLSELRYGGISILTDQDVDGSHIKGLLINFLHFYWPSLLKIPGFLTVFNTPLIKASKGNDSKIFYNESEFKDWYKNNSTKGWYIKYYKGLGTSSAKEAKEYFKDFEKNLQQIVYKNEDKGTDSIKLAFSKKEADRRKKWLGDYDKEVYIDRTQKIISLPTFVNEEFIHFSSYDNVRSLPKVLDGLKPSQRKAIFGILKRNLTKEIKVAQIAAYIADVSVYHHGENSMQQTVINMAQDYVGSNNINLFKPNGQFGTRLMGGADSASPRYIFTIQSEITPLIYKSFDNPILKYELDDNKKIEPVSYLPIICMALVNGSIGIGTGYSTKIPNHNPRDIIDNIKRKINNESYKKMQPWYRNFNGIISKKNNITYNCRGLFTVNKNYVTITELPIGKWTYKYQDFLDNSFVEKGKTKKSNFVQSYEKSFTDVKVEFKIKMDKTFIEKWLNNVDSEGITDLEKVLKLNDTISISNMYLFDPNNIIKKYKNPEAILDDFYESRLEGYNLRKKYLLDKLKNELIVLDAKTKFILAIIKNKLKISNRKKDDIIKDLEKMKLPKIKNDNNVESYDYLLKLLIFNLTKEKVEELLAQQKKTEVELSILSKKSNTDLWLEDLEILEQYLNKIKY